MERFANAMTTTVGIGRGMERFTNAEDVLILGRLDVVAERGRRRGRVGRLLLVALAPSLTDLLVALAPVAFLTGF